MLMIHLINLVMHITGLSCGGGGVPVEDTIIRLDDESDILFLLGSVDRDYHGG